MCQYHESLVYKLSWQWIISDVNCLIKLFKKTNLIMVILIKQVYKEIKLTN